MKWTPWLVGSLTLAVMAGCGGERRNTDTGAAGAGTETGTMQGEAGTGTDTAAPGTGDLSSDTAQADAQMHEDMHNPGAATGATDSAKGNQTKSGVTNTKTGKSTLGEGVTKTRPDQGEPVTSKGDTVSGRTDSTLP